MLVPLLTVTILCICSLIFVVWSRIQVTQLGYQISQASHKQTQLLQINNQLKIEEASLKSPARIENIAEEQLGLNNPEPQQKVFIP